VGRGKGRSQRCQLDASTDLEDRVGSLPEDLYSSRSGEGEEQKVDQISRPSEEMKRARRTNERGRR